MAMLPWWIHYPNVNDEIINLDWILQVSNENTDKIESFIGINTIKYADPILWDITSQYEANTIVVDPQTGDAYISTKAVPYGVALSNEGYWTRIYNYASELHVLREQIAADEQLSTTATAPRSIDDLVFLNGLLYIITAPMIAGDSYVVGSNCAKTTINAQLLRLHDSIRSEATARANADTQLQTNIDNEATARANADAQLQTNIDNEATARANADAQLQNIINNDTVKKIKNVLTIGDSFGDTVLHEQNPDVFGSWVLEFIDMTDYDNVYNYCKNSAGYYSTQERPYLTLAQEAAAAIDPLTIDLVIVQGGLNDVASGRTDGNTGTINIDNTFDFIKQTFTNARILIVPMTWSATFNGREPFLPSYQIWAMHIIESAINHGFDIATTPWLWQIGHGDFVGSDNFHPNNAGAKNIAGHIKANINGCDSVLYEHTEGTIAQNMYISWTLDGGTITMRGVLMGVAWNGASIVQPMPEELVPPKYGSMSQLFSAYTDVNGTLELVNAGYQLGVQPDGRGNLIFYGGALTNVASGTQVNLYFEHSFTV